ncbi:MAG: DUF4250 domain-containing protein [Prevotella sp.]|nr:DUF4250 domain-containing protein [Prevotella sp.]
MDFLPKDPAILVSSVNMLLRDEEFDTLESLCYAFSREPKEIKDYLMNSSPIKLGQNRPKQTLNRIA